MTKCYLLVATLLVSSAASAQQLRFGLKAGASYAKNTYSSDRHAQQNNHRLLGVSGGLVVRYAVVPTGAVSLQTELLYVGKGRRLNEFGQPDSWNIKERLHYVELPVLARLSLRQFALPSLAGGYLDLNKLTIEVGPQVSTLVAHNYVGSKVAAEPVSSRFYRSDYATLQLGFATGVGYELQPGWDFTLRHTRDITGVMRGNGVKGRRNSVLQAQVSYLLGGSH